MELSATTGGLAKAISGRSYKFAPTAIATNRTHVSVANSSRRGGSVTELSARTGGLVQVISGPSYKLSNAVAIASDGTHVWVPDNAGRKCPSL